MAYLTKHYDEYNLLQKNSDVTDAELSLIQTLATPGAKVLDIGCGTGRHLLPLLQMGYEVVGIDNNQEMLDSLLTKNPGARILNASIVDKVESLKQKIQNKSKIKDPISKTFILSPLAFDLIISMWNSFNEYALTEAAAKQALQNMRDLLVAGGKVLLNIEDAAKLNPEQLNYTHQVMHDDVTYKLESKLESFDSTTNTTTCVENLQVSNESEAYTGEVIQRWWGIEELRRIAEEVGLQITRVHHLPVNQELYVELTK